MGKKVKSKECKGRWCETHLFSIRPLFQGGTNTKQEMLRLCPKYDSSKKQFMNCLPELNLDKKHYTPLFVLEQDRRLYTEYDDRNRSGFQRNQEEEEYQISQIVKPPSDNSNQLPFLLSFVQLQMVPKVGNHRRYCKVCKDDYDDYLEHINSGPHRIQVSKNPYSAFIAELQENLKPTIQKQTEKQNQKKLSSSPEHQPFELQIDTILPDRESLTHVKDSIMEIYFRDNYQ